jgi:hypothetical protein
MSGKPIGPGDRVRRSDGREAICCSAHDGVVHGLECRAGWPWPVAAVQWAECECTRLPSGRERPEKRITRDALKDFTKQSGDPPV